MSELIARHGDAMLRRRADGVLVLRVNGVFVMDDAESSSERALARAVRLPAGARVLVGGLGLGFTVRDLLSGDVAEVVVAEVKPAVPAWMADGLIPGGDLMGTTVSRSSSRTSAMWWRRSRPRALTRSCSTSTTDLTSWSTRQTLRCTGEIFSGCALES